MLKPHHALTHLSKLGKAGRIGQRMACILSQPGIPFRPDRNQVWQVARAQVTQETRDRELMLIGHGSRFEPIIPAIIGGCTKERETFPRVPLLNASASTERA